MWPGEELVDVTLSDGGTVTQQGGEVVGATSAGGASLPVVGASGIVQQFANLITYSARSAIDRKNLDAQSAARASAATLQAGVNAQRMYQLAILGAVAVGGFLLLGKLLK